MKKICALITAIYTITAIGMVSAQEPGNADSESAPPANELTDPATDDMAATDPADVQTTDGDHPEEVADTKPQAVLLISEVSFQDPEKDWVELFAVEDGTITGWTLEDDRTIYTFEEMSVERGDIVVVKIEKGLTGTSEQVIVRNTESKIVDAVCWANDSTPASEKKDMEKLFKEGGWISDNPETCIRSEEVGKGWSIGRRAAWDTDSSQDWKVFHHPTPQAMNADVNHAPRARIGIQSGATTRETPLQINIASQSQDPDGDPLTYRWEFAQSATADTPNPIPLITSDKENPPSYTFGEPGFYTITLTVTDPFGAESTHALQITVLPPPEPKPQCTQQVSQSCPTQIACPTTAACPTAPKCTATPKCPDIKIPDFSEEIAKLPICKIDQTQNAQKTKQTDEKSACEPKPLIPVFLAEIFPNPTGKDDGAEWIKLVNTGSQDLLIQNWKLRYGTTEIPVEGKIAAHKVMTIAITKNSLRNKGDHIKLITPEALIQDETIYDNAANNAIYAKLPDGTWEWEKTENETAGTTADIKTKTQSDSTAKDATVTKTPAKIAKNGDLSTNITISEIMPNPAGTDADNEWIELWNNGDTDINLGDWKIKTPKKSFTIPDSIVIAARTHRALDANDIALALINTGDTIELRDFRDALMDSVTYEKAPDDESFAKIEIETVGNETPDQNAARAASQNKQMLWQWTTDITKNKPNPSFKRISGTIIETKPETFTLAAGNRNFQIVYSATELDPQIAHMIIAPNTELEIITEPIADNIHALKELHVIKEAGREEKTGKSRLKILLIILLCAGGGSYLIAKGIPQELRTRLHHAINGFASKQIDRMKKTWEKQKEQKDYPQTRDPSRI